MSNIKNYPYDEPMNDESIMPFGKHKGEKLCNVPGGYLLFLYNSDGFHEKNPGMTDYIAANMEDIVDRKKAESKAYFEAKNKAEKSNGVVNFDED